MEGEFQDQGHIGQYSENWFSPRGIQPNRGLFSEYMKQGYTWIEIQDPDGATTTNQAPEGVIYTMVVVKWSDNVEGQVEKIDDPLCGGLYKEQYRYIFTWSVTDPDVKINCFNFSKEENDWIVPGHQYNEDLNSQLGPIQNGKLCSQTLKEKRKTEDKCAKYAGSDKFNGISREGNLEILINYYKDQCRENKIRNGMWDVLSLPYPPNK